MTRMTPWGLAVVMGVVGFGLPGMRARIRPQTPPPAAPATAPARPRPEPKPEPEPEPELTTEQVVARSEASVAVVRGEKGVGTGFLVRPGVLVTNAHVIAREKVAGLTVRFPSAPPRDRQARVAGLVWEDARRDLAILNVDSRLPPLPVDAAYRFRRGQEVTVIGNPGTVNGDVLENAVSRGVMSARMTYEGQAYFQMSIAINPGNSGGPVFNPGGRVVGVATLKDTRREGIAFCIPVDELAAAVGRAESVSDADARAANALHDSRPVSEALDGLGQVYLSALETQASFLDQVGARGADPASARVVIQRAFRSKLGDDLRRMSTERLYPEVCRAAADPDLPLGVRKGLSALWESCLELQKCAERPPASSRSLRDKARALQARHTRLAGSLQRAFEPGAVDRAPKDVGP